MKLIKGLEPRPPAMEFSGVVGIDSSICYDFVVSLRALFNPRTYKKSRRWAAAQLPRLGEEVLPKGKFFFQGFDTALGYGATRVVKRLPAGAGPPELIQALSDMAAAELATFMLDTGETSRARLDLFRRVLGGDASRLNEALDGLPPGWATRCRHVLLDPEAAQADLVQVFQAHLGEIYGHHQEAVTESIRASMPVALATLDILPALEAIERLTGGYTLGSDLGLRTITLAPSVFLHPFMSTRVDEDLGEALILYGVPSEIFDSYDPVAVRGDLVTALKAMSDPSRLTVLQLLAEQPLYTVELVQHLRLAPTTVHHHLAQLRTAGLIRQQRNRNGMQYSIRTEPVVQLIRALEDWILHPTQEVIPAKEARP
ncbi:MAG: winged helix-turn-helix transcriptional regulator [Geodermatophilaceae bacterium]|nr:winged helix-turn-helix transcriptional regulator [Geodermatophilaceae bacterium]